MFRIPDSVSYDEAVVVMTAGSPLYGLERAGGYFAGETVAVLGPGPIGLMAVQLVKALGAVRVILTGTRPARLVLGKELGADVTVNSREQDPVAAVREATGGRGADVTVDCAGGDDTFDQAIKMTKPGGRVVLVDAHQHPVFAQAQDVAGHQAVDAAFAQWFRGVVHEHAVAAEILDDVVPGAEMHARMVAGKKTVGVRQRPVIVQRTPDAAARDPQHNAAAGA